MNYRSMADRKEVDSFIEMIRLAFNVSPDEMRFWQDMLGATTGNSRGLFDSEGRLLCGMSIIDNGALYFRSDRPITTALITAVASPPQHRRKGYIRQLFEGMYTEQREQGVALTALYPFYFPFYRSFGYELAHDSANCSVKIGQFRQWRKAAERGTFVPLDITAIKEALLKKDEKGGKGDSEAALSDVMKLQTMYAAWAKGNLGMIARDDKWWLRKFFHKEQPVPAYIYYDPEGRPAGYIIYHLEDKGNWIRDMVIHEMVGVDREAREAIYGFIYNHDSQAEKAAFWTPVDAAFPSLLNDPREAEVKVHAGYMLRLLNVEGAFHQRAFVPEAQGEFTFALTDEMVPEISGAYHVAVADGKASVERLKGGAEEKAGISLDARALAQLYSGYKSPRHAAAGGQIKVHREEDVQGMQTALYPAGQPAPYMADGF
jgi:predicted acetyltransferase